MFNVRLYIELLRFIKAQENNISKLYFSRPEVLQEIKSGSMLFSMYSLYVFSIRN